MRRTLLLLAAALGLAFACGPVLAQWKWREAGQTHVSDLPPPREVPEKDILQRPTTLGGRKFATPAPVAAAAAASGAASAAASVDTELEARRRKLEQEQQAQRKQEKAAEDAKVAAVRAENCRRAQESLRTLDSGVRIARVNAQGEREVLDDNARAEDARRARSVIASDCR